MWYNCTDVWGKQQSCSCDSLIHILNIKNKNSYRGTVLTEYLGFIDFCAIFVPSSVRLTVDPTSDNQIAYYLTSAINVFQLFYQFLNIFAQKRNVQYLVLNVKCIQHSILTHWRLLCGLIAWVKRNWCILGVVVFNPIILYNYS